MSEMKVIDLNQCSKEWLAWRAKGVTASDVPVILGLSPYKTPWQLWAEKIGRIEAPDISNNPNVKRGVRLEDEARQLAEGRYGEVLLPLCGECSQWNVLRASFDGLDSAKHPYEFKAPGEKVWDSLVDDGVESDAYKLYEAQVHAQCVVAGTNKGRLIFYKEDGQDLDFEVSLSEERRSEILVKAKVFWEQVVSKKPPELDPEKDWFLPKAGPEQSEWEDNVDAWRSKHQRIQALKDELKVLEKEQKVIQKDIITLMGPFMQADVGGVRVTRFIKKGSVDYSLFLQDMFPEQDVTELLESYRKSSREESRFSLSEYEPATVDVVDSSTTAKSAYF